MINPYELLKSGKSLDDINKLICDELTAAQQKIDVEKAEEAKKAAAAKKAEAEKKAKTLVMHKLKVDAATALYNFFKAADEDTVWTKEVVSNFLDQLVEIEKTLKKLNVKVLKDVNPSSFVDIFDTFSKWF